MDFLSKFRKKEPERICTAVIVAAGSSARMGFDKLTAELAGEPVILRSIRAFQAAPCIQEIVVVTRDDLIGPVAALCKENGLDKVSKVIRGGATRTQSARLGTLEARRDANLIAIHDAARPLVPAEVIQAAVEQAGKNGAAAPSIPLKDTVKQVQGGIVKTTLDRSLLQAVQTPQVFDADLIRAALQKALDDRADLTDDCMAVERLGMQVVLTPGSERNIKLTTPQDLTLAEAILDREALG